MSATRWPTRAIALVSAAVVGAAVAPTWTAEAAVAPTTLSYSSPGSFDWTVPTDVRRVAFEVAGGHGGSAVFGGYAVGLANRTTASIRVVPGTVLHLHVGGNGAARSAGSNGGGAVGIYAGGGGGASDIRIGGDSLADRVLVAAGGGGASPYGAAGGAGQPGSTPLGGCSPAQPGTSTAGGAAAPSCEGSNVGGNGSLGLGGSGASTGGGGGGGYYGGAGGGDFGGGAGGSSLVPAGARGVTSGLTSVSPSVKLTYAVSTPTTIAVSTTAVALPADDGVSTTTVSATVIDQNDDNVPNDAVTFASDDPAMDFGLISTDGDGTYTAQVSSSDRSGPVTITATDSSAPAVTGSSGLTMTALTQTVAFAAPAPTGLVVGEDITPAVTQGGSGNPVVLGVGSATTGYGTAAVACSVTGGTASLDHPGSCVLTADQAGNAQYSAATTALQTLAVGQAATLTSLSVTPSLLTAHVTPVAPGAGSPDGTVTFAVDGSDVGTAPVTAGLATLSYEVPTSAGAHQVAATYSGGVDFTGSSTSTSSTNPTLTAHLSSAGPTTRGWYRNPVTVSFTCTSEGAVLTAPCPTPVTLASSAAGQSVTRTIQTTDGGVATAVASGINIDRVSPRPQVSGVETGSTYMGKAPASRCVALDALSGALSCTIRLSRAGQSVRYTATAVDVAGNTSQTAGSYRVLRTYLRDVSYQDGRFLVKAGARYTILTSTSGSTAPRFLGRISTEPSSKRGRRFHAVRSSDGVHHWSLRVRVRARLVGPQRFYVLRVDGTGTRRPISLRVSPRRR